MSKKLSIVSNKTSEPFAKELVEYIQKNSDINVIYNNLNLDRHPDGELKLYIQETVRGSTVFYFCPFYPNPLERYSETLITAGAIKDASAEKLILVPTYLGFTRSDWKPKSREPITIKYVSNTLALNVDGLLTMDLHSPQVQGMMRYPVNVLESYALLRDWYKTLDIDKKETIIIAPDSGGTKRAEKAKDILGVDEVDFIRKSRLNGEDVSSTIPETVDGMHVIMPDDIISTGGTMIKAAEGLKNKGAKSVNIFATHGVFAPRNGKSSEDFLTNSDYIDNIGITNTIQRSSDWEEKYKGKITVMDTNEIFSQAVIKITNDESLHLLHHY